jgi:protein transport protein SEC31
MQRVKARAPASYKDQVLEVERRVNLLFDSLNSSVFESGTLGKIKELADNLSKREHEEATRKVTELMKIVDGGQGWLVGVKRLVVMSKATPA